MSGSPQAVAAVLLAAGSSTRMGSPKALLDCGGETFLDRLIRVFGACCRPVITVSGSHTLAMVSGIERAEETLWVQNPNPDRGMLSSLQCGLVSVPAACGAVFFHPVDMPLVDPTTIEQMISCLARAPATIAMVVPRRDDRLGHPVLVRTRMISAFLDAPEGATARDVVHGCRHLSVFLDVQDPGILEEFNTPEQYRTRFGGAS